MILNKILFSFVCFVFMIIGPQRERKINTQKLMKDIVTSQELTKYSKAYFASGCFWCVEAVFESIKGVKEVISGYSGGKEENPSYYKVGSGMTGHAESVEIFYDSSEVTFKELVVAFFGSHNPTQLNGQGPDKGRQYRSIAFYQNNAEKDIIKNYIKELENTEVYDRPIVTQVLKFTKFWKAEDYHQDYEKLNPNNPYIRSVSIPRLERFQNKHPNLLKKKTH